VLGPIRQFTGWSRVVTVGTLGVNVSVGSGVFVGGGVLLGMGVSVGRAGVLVPTGVSVGVDVKGRLQDDTISIMSKFKIRNLCFMASPFVLMFSILSYYGRGVGSTGTNGHPDHLPSIGILIP
jgi:hypothetical protein